MKSYQIPLILVIVNNLFPIAGFMFFGWEVFNVLFFLWLEVFIIFIGSGIKILGARKRRLKPKSLILLTVFAGSFLCSYLLFLYGTTGRYFEIELLWYAIIPMLIYIKEVFSFKKYFMDIDADIQVEIILRKLVTIIIVGTVIGSLGQYGAIIVLLILKACLDYSNYLKENRIY